MVRTRSSCASKKPPKKSKASIKVNRVKLDKKKEREKARRIALKKKPN